MGVIVRPSARETFTPRELVAAYKELTEHGPQHQDAETGLSASAYRFGERVLLVYEESETDVVVLNHRSAEKGNSQKSISTILHSLPLWERRMAYFHALELIAKHKILEERVTIPRGERQKPGQTETVLP